MSDFLVPRAGRGCVLRHQQRGEPSYVLYLGNYLDAEIVRERGLPGHNTAGSNRMRRLAGALAAAGYSPIIVSSATSLRMYRPGRLMNPARVRHDGRTVVAFTGALNPGGLGLIAEPFFMLAVLRRLARKFPINNVIIYNFSPSLYIAALYVKYFLKLRIFNNVEDVSIPRRSDWFQGTEVRPTQQLVFYACMKAIARLATGFVLPTARFERYVSQGKPTVVAPGCITVSDEPAVRSQNRGGLRILFSGKIEFEHGIDVFVEALRRLEADGATRIASVDICGGGRKAGWLEEQLPQFGMLSVKYHGFVVSEQYRQLLRQADLCVALQRPDGRYGDLKTPSKVFEYLGFGKAVIATAVGDLDKLPKDVIVLCDPLKSLQLCAAIQTFCNKPRLAAEMGERALRYAQEQFSFEEIGLRMRNMFETANVR